jgi:hypothetical protein
MFDSNGEITPPCGAPLVVSLATPSSITPASSHFRHQLEHPPIRDSPRDELHQLVVLDAPEVVADVGVEHVMASRPPFGSVSSAIVALRFGRKPYEHGRKSASKIGSSTSFAAICATRSRTVGMPSGLLFPSAFGMYRRRTNVGRYVPSRSADRALRGSDRLRTVRHRESVWLVDARRTRFARTRFHASQQDVTPAQMVVQRMEASTRCPLGRAHSRRCSCRTLSRGLRRRGR